MFARWNHFGFVSDDLLRSWLNGLSQHNRAMGRSPDPAPTLNGHAQTGVNLALHRFAERWPEQPRHVSLGAQVGEHDEPVSRCRASNGSGNPRQPPECGTGEDASPTAIALARPSTVHFLIVTKPASQRSRPSRARGRGRARP
jgi:hypothetical protein